MKSDLRLIKTIRLKTGIPSKIPWTSGFNYFSLWVERAHQIGIKYSQDLRPYSNPMTQDIQGNMQPSSPSMTGYKFSNEEMQILAIFLRLNKKNRNSLNCMHHCKDDISFNVTNVIINFVSRITCVSFVFRWFTQWTMIFSIVGYLNSNMIRVIYTKFLSFCTYVCIFSYVLHNVHL